MTRQIAVRLKTEPIAEQVANGAVCFLFSTDWVSSLQFSLHAAVSATKIAGDKKPRPAECWNNNVRLAGYAPTTLLEKNGGTLRARNERWTNMWANARVFRIHETTSREVGRKTKLKLSALHSLAYFCLEEVRKNPCVLVPNRLRILWLVCWENVAKS